jgi:antitoxin component YwqK of YwqJK toxin-antitoxin module
MNARLSALSLTLLLATLCLAQPGAAINRKDAQGRRQGPWQRTWAESSQLRYTGQFKDDRPVGSFIYYSTAGTVESRIDHYPGSNAAHGRHFHPNGVLMAEGRYVGEAKDSTWNYYGTDGILLSTEHWKNGRKEGEQITFFPNGKVTERTHFADSVQVGKAELFYPDGTPRYTATYVNGAPEGMETYYFANGKKQIEGMRVNGNRDGAWLYYNNDGTLQVQVLYAQGKYVKEKRENGDFKDYYDDDQLKSEVTYRKGLREGPFTEWYDNGKWVSVPVELGPQGERKQDEQRELKGQTKKREGSYLHDALDGPVKEYDESGKLLSNLEYVNGAPATGGNKP